MKTNRLIVFFFLLMFLAGCQAGGSVIVTPEPLPTVVPLSGEPLAVALVVEHATPTSPAAEPTPTADPAAAAVTAYAGAVQSGDYTGAAEMLSRFSLAAAGLTPGEAADEIQARMANEAWSNFEVTGSQAVDPKLSLVQVAYRVAANDPQTGEAVETERAEVWAVRLESGEWRCNRANLVDFRTLDEAGQTTGGLTVKPRRIERYTDRVRLVLLVQNQTNEPIVLGQVNETLAMFAFGETRVEAEPARFIFDRLRSYPETVIEVKGWFERYPDGVVIRQWKNYQTDPWFSFKLGR